MAEPSAQVAASLDVCHIGVVLRAVLVVHALLTLGVGFVSNGFVDTLLRLSTGLIVSVPAVLLWLVLACALKDGIARLNEALQWAVLALLGAVSAWVAAWPLRQFEGLLVSDGQALTWLYGWPLPAAGAAGAVAVFHWLRARQHAQAPAVATAKLVELQSRIRPHFLFNTLNTAIALVRVDPSRAEAVLEDLAELFRVALAEVRDQVTLDDEVELARRYLAIEQIRFGARLQVVWDLDPKAGSAKLPPLLLQPLVENAVKHGVEPQPDGGTVLIRSRVRRGLVLLTVVNSLSAQGSQPGHGLALRNVRERLMLMHDVAAQFDAGVYDGQWRVRIALPLS